jgi:acyl carrier protein
VEDEKFRQLIALVKKCSPDAITLKDDTDIVKDIGLDSLELTEFFYHVEDRFQIEIDYGKLEPGHLRNYRKLKAFLLKADDSAAPQPVD